MFDLFLFPLTAPEGGQILWS